MPRNAGARPRARTWLAVIAIAAAIQGGTVAGADPGSVLILDTTVSGGMSSIEAQTAVAQGFGVDIVNATTWSAMTTEDFADYRAIILGDPHCASGTSRIAAAAGNAQTWADAVAGPVVVIGTDPEWHRSRPGAVRLIQSGIAFATSDAEKTGAYITLSCYYHGTAAGTPVPLLDGFGSFTVTGVGCFNNAHIVATHPAFSTLTDADLSNWSCSVHEGFDSWPDLEFEVLAIARNFGSVYTATDGTVGTPYILARGVRVISDIDLAPEEAVRRVTQSHTLEATVTEDDVPVEGVEVTFEVVAGPHAGTIGTGTTNAEGVASFSYVGSGTGTDVAQARFTDSLGRPQRSNRVTVEWVACLENGFGPLDGTPAEGAASAIVHDTAEPAADSISGDLGALVHTVNCTIVEPLEVALENELGG